MDGVAPGQALRLYIPVLYGHPKEKYCVLACLEPKIRLLLINSEINEVILAQPEMSECHIPIDAESHPFLRQDSYIDCNDPVGHPDDELERQLKADPTRILGVISDDVCREIRRVIPLSPLLSSYDIEWMLEGLPDP